MSDKPLIWVGSSRNDLKAFPRDARRMAGFQLRRVQQGLEPNDSKAMPSVGPGTQEIRIHTGRTHRERDLQLARDRFRALVMKRRG